MDLDSSSGSTSSRPPITKTLTTKKTRLTLLIFTLFTTLMGGYAFIGQSKLLGLFTKNLRSQSQILRSHSNSVQMSHKPLVVAGPSGVGKGTLIKEVMSEYPTSFGFSTSHTTRNPRPGEMDGREYYFTTKEKMTQMIVNGEFLEHAEVHTNFYGTSRQAVQNVQDSGKVCILDIDVQGVKTLKKADSFDAYYIFIAPPSMEILEQRLRGRKTETEEAILKRINNAKEELVYGKTPGNFDSIIINDNLQEAVEQFKTLIWAWYPGISSEDEFSS
mmetsp:Transcript_38907/g.49668  ORF Transcript_38907/g.49668 Transcript_38907/m.49668 type:complete len:274 (-) Transcript_38907:311-1132(-)